MNKFYKQSTTFTCGVTALKNCFASLGETVSELSIRSIAGTTKKGTDSKGLIRAITKHGYKYKEIKNTITYPFLNRVKKELMKGNVLLLLTDHADHWVSMINYVNKNYYIIDPQRDQALEKYLTGRELAVWANNFDKKKHITYYYAISILRKL